MTLNQLEYFCAVCRYRSITRAADELYVSQPTISVAIRGLEKEFNLQLFIHGKNRIALTDDGERFYEKAQALLDQRQELYTEFSALGHSQRPIKLGIPPLISTFFFPRMIDAFHEQSDTPVQLFEYGSVWACNLVDSRELDLAMVNLDYYDIEKFNYFVMMTDYTIYCVSKTHRFADEPEITIDMLRDEPIILYNTDSVMNMIVNARFHALGMAPRVLMHSSQLYTILNFVRGGNCGAFLYSTLAVNPRDFVQIPVKPEITTRFGIVWRRGPVNKNVQEFLDFAQAYQTLSSGQV